MNQGLWLVVGGVIGSLSTFLLMRKKKNTFPPTEIENHTADSNYWRESFVALLGSFPPFPYGNQLPEKLRFLREQFKDPRACVLDTNEVDAFLEHWEPRIPYWKQLIHARELLRSAHRTENHKARSIAVNMTHEIITRSEGLVSFSDVGIELQELTFKAKEEEQSIPALTAV